MFLRTTEWRVEVFENMNCVANRALVYCGYSFAIFDFCAGNRHQIMARAWVKAVNVTPLITIEQMDFEVEFRIWLSL